ncbi:MAG: hypothetical protein ACT4OG_03445 [Alphaproteobacteria bacterium]
MAVAPAFANSDVRRNGVSAAATRVWIAGLAILLAPAIAAWALRGIGFILQCDPAAASCLGEPFDTVLAAALRGSLDLAWFVSTTVPLALGIVFLAAMAAIIALRPVSAGLTVLIAPLAVLLLPILLINATRYDGCQINADGLGECTVWGQPMGMSFHSAEIAPQFIYTYAPLAVSGAVVIGLLGAIVLWGSKQMKKA